MSRAPLKTTIERAGQPYLDEIVYVHPKMLSPLEAALAAALKSTAHPRRPVPVGFNRVPLVWKNRKGS